MDVVEFVIALFFGLLIVAMLIVVVVNLFYELRKPTKQKNKQEVKNPADSAGCSEVL